MKDGIEEDNESGGNVKMKARSSIRKDSGGEEQAELIELGDWKRHVCMHIE